MYAVSAAAVYSVDIDLYIGLKITPRSRCTILCAEFHGRGKGSAAVDLIFIIIITAVNAFVKIRRAFQIFFAVLSVIVLYIEIQISFIPPVSVVGNLYCYLDLISLCCGCQLFNKLCLGIFVLGTYPVIIRIAEEIGICICFVKVTVVFCQVTVFPIGRRRYAYLAFRIEFPCD